MDMYKRWGEERTYTRHVLEALAENPGASYYKLTQAIRKKGYGDISHVAVMREAKLLKAQRLVRAESGPRRSERCWLTFGGLWYAVSLGAIPLAQGHKVRLAHGIKLPIEDDVPPVKLVEKNFPEAFYGFLQGFSPADFHGKLPGKLPERFIIKGFFAIMSMVILVILANKPEYRERFYLGGVLHFPDGSTLPGFDGLEEGLKFMCERFRPFGLPDYPSLISTFGQHIQVELKNGSIEIRWIDEPLPFYG
jgi:DNA-binding transcriptional ArsR family regulator